MKIDENDKNQFYLLVKKEKHVIMTLLNIKRTYLQSSEGIDSIPIFQLYEIRIKELMNC